VPLEIESNRTTSTTLRTKRERMGHMLAEFADEDVKPKDEDDVA